MNFKESFISELDSKYTELLSRSQSAEFALNLGVKSSDSFKKKRAEYLKRLENESKAKADAEATALANKRRRENSEARQRGLEKQYAEAKSVFEKGNYNDAKSRFEKIKTFKDSKSYIDECQRRIDAKDRAKVIGKNMRFIIPMLVVTLLAVVLMLVPALVYSFLPWGWIIPIIIVYTALMGYLLYNARVNNYDSDYKPLAIIPVLVISVGALIMVMIVPAQSVIEIDSRSDMAMIKNYGFADYELTSDIDYEQDRFHHANTFTGTLDGNGYTIKNVDSLYPLVEYNEGVIKNITFDKVTIYGRGVVANSSAAGTFDNITIKNSKVNGNSSSYGVGMLCGQIYTASDDDGRAAVSKIYIYDSEISSSGSNEAGGAIGKIYATNGMKVSDILVDNVKIEGSGNSAGGIVGYASSPGYYKGNRVLLTNCSVNNCTISTSKSKGHAGGIVGYAYGNGDHVDIEYFSVVDTKISATNNGYVGGIVGYTVVPMSISNGYTIATSDNSTFNWGTGYIQGGKTIYTNVYGNQQNACSYYRYSSADAELANTYDNDDVTVGNMKMAGWVLNTLKLSMDYWTIKDGKYPTLKAFDASEELPSAEDTAFDQAYASIATLNVADSFKAKAMADLDAIIKEFRNGELSGTYNDVLASFDSKLSKATKIQELIEGAKENNSLKNVLDEDKEAILEILNTLESELSIKNLDEEKVRTARLELQKYIANRLLDLGDSLYTPEEYFTEYDYTAQLKRYGKTVISDFVELEKELGVTNEDMEWNTDQPESSSEY